MNEKLDILLIEDNPGDARLIREMLAGVEVGSWPTFELEWVDRLSTGLERMTAGGVDIVLLDLSLPDSRGLDTLAQVRAQTPETPIIVLTGLDDEAVAVEAVRAGAQDYLIKGQVDLRLLARAMRYAIERQQAEEALRKLSRAVEQSPSATVITVRKQAEQALRRYADEQEALYAVASAAASSLDPDALLSTVLDTVLPIVDSQAGWVELPGATLDDPPHVVTWRGLPDEFVAAEESFPLRDCPVCAPLLTGEAPTFEPMLCTECPCLPAEIHEGASLHSHVGIPLSAGDKVLGILNVGWGAARPYTEAERKLLIAIGQQVGVALQNAQLYQRARQVDRLRVINELDKALAATLEPQRVEEVTLRQIAAALDAPEALWIPAPPPAGEEPRRILALDEGWVEVAPGDRYADWPRFLQRMQDLQGTSYPAGDEAVAPGYLLVPIQSDGQAVADLILGGRPADRPFSDEDKALAQAAAHRAGQAIARARQHATLKKAEARYRSLYHGVPVGLYRTSPQGKILAANRALVQILGYPDEETLLATKVTDLYVDAEDRRRWQAMTERGEEAHSLELQFRRYDGSLLWGQSIARTVRDESGQVVYYEESLVDITERIRAEKALKESQQSYVTLVNSIEGIVWEADAQTFQFTFVSNQAERLLGYPTERWIAEPTFWQDHIYDQDREQAVSFCALATAEHRDHELEYRMIAADGRLVWLRDIVNVIVENGRAVKLRGVMVDITERKQAEDELRQSEAGLAKAQRIAHLGNWDWNVATGELWWSDEIYRIFGLAPQEFGVTYDAFLEAVHPDDRELVTRSVNQALHEGQPYSIDHRILLPDGSERVVHEQAEVVFDEAGQPARMVGTVQDVTTRVRLEERLAAIYQLGRELTLLHDEDVIIQRVLETAGGVIQSEFLGCGLVDGAAGELVVQRRMVNGTVKQAGLRLPLDGERGIILAVVRDGQMINLPDTRQDPHYLSIPESPLCLSELCAPLKIGERVIGVLDAESVKPNHFTSADEQLLQILADQTAAALENARLYRATQAHVARLTTLNAISTAINASLDMDVVISQILELTCQALDATSGSILLRDTDELAFVGTITDEADVLGDQRLRLGKGLAEWVASHGQALRVDDVRQDSRFYDGLEQVTGLEIQSFLGVPLKHHRQISGVIEIVNKRQGVFSDEDLSLLEAVSPIASVALENARLYDEQEALLHEREQIQAQLVRNEKMSALGRLVASLAHEINNPLQAVQGCLTLAGEELEEEGRREKVDFYLDIAADEIERIAAIVRRMRDFYRPAGEEKQPTDLHAVLDSVLALSGKQLQHSDVIIVRDWAEELPRVTANPDHLKQVFLNLVLNAMDAMPEGGVLQVSTAQDQMMVELDQPPRPAVRIAFRDSGLGLSPDVQDLIFEPFFTTKEQGSGLGLSICYRIVQAHGGQIGVESQEGEGATFTLLLPV